MASVGAGEKEGVGEGVRVSWGEAVASLEAELPGKAEAVRVGLGEALTQADKDGEGEAVALPVGELVGETVGVTEDVLVGEIVCDGVDDGGRIHVVPSKYASTEQKPRLTKSKPFPPYPLFTLNEGTPAFARNDEDPVVGDNGSIRDEV